MKVRKGAVGYISLLLMNSFIIYYALYKEKTVLLFNEQRQTGAFVLDFQKLLYLSLGMLLLAFTVYLCTFLRAYRVAKIFASYIVCIDIIFSLMACTDYRYNKINIFMGILAMISNYLLFYLTGCLTLAIKKKYYRWMTVAYTIVAVGMSLTYLIGVNGNKPEKSAGYINANYVITAAFIILSLVVGYKETTQYSQYQIKLLIMGMLAGIFILIFANTLSAVAVISIPNTSVQNQKEEESGLKITKGDDDVVQIYYPEGRKNTYPVICFVGIAIVIVYLLIQREYFVPDSERRLQYYLGTSLYFLVGNVIFRLIISDNKEEFFLFNILLILPFYSHMKWGILQESGCYSRNMLERLEEERQNLSIYLHDEILQRMIMLRHYHDEKEIHREISGIIKEIRNISQNLYPTIAEDLGLEEALRILIEELNIDYNIEIEYRYLYPKGILPKEISLALYRIIKELIMNAIKHSQGNHIYVKIHGEKKGIACLVSDNGVGFQNSGREKLLNSPHMGMYTIRKQIAELKGSMQSVSDLSGSKFQIFLPLEK